MGHKRKTPAVTDPRTATVYSHYEPYAYFERAASPVIPILTRELTELDAPRPLVLPQYFKLVPFVESIAAANPVIPFRYGMGRFDELVPVVQPPRADVPPYAVTADIDFRYGRMVQDGPLALVPSQYYTFPYQPAVAPSNPVLPIRKGQWISDAIPPLVGIQGYYEFPWVSNQVTPTNPIIPIRTRPLSELRYAEPLPRSSYFAFIPYPPAPSQVIRFRQGQWLGDQVAPLVGIQGYHEFPYWRAPVPASPVIAFRRGQWLADAVQPLVGMHGYYPFPCVSETLYQILFNVVHVSVHVTPRLTRDLTVAQDTHHACTISQDVHRKLTV